jgi:hypothetical protein
VAHWDPDPTDNPWAPFLADLARAADVCLKPDRHAVRFAGPDPGSAAAMADDCTVRFEVREPSGERRPERDLELEIYRSGSELNLMLCRVANEHTPLLWHGSHPVWMQAASGERCQRPVDGAPLEALCRRIRALLVSASP